jgi:putative cell wall-binding protein
MNPRRLWSLVAVVSLLAVAGTFSSGSLAQAREAEDGPALDSAAAGVVSGTLYAFRDPLTVQTIGTGSVVFYSTVPPYNRVASTTFFDQGDFTLSNVPAGTYTVSFTGAGSLPTPMRGWFDGERLQRNATTVTLVEGEPYAFGSIVLPLRDIAYDRVYGSNRFATAVALSQSSFVDGSSPKVFIVNGLTFPDALSGGALAASGGALLLVEQNRIPDVVLAELDRLNPSEITIIGGTGVVSAAVQTQLASFVDNASLVTRIAGANRYDTSRQVISSANGFNGNVDALFVATGLNYPDALSAVPAAGYLGGALLLVNGSATSLDQATRDLVASLGTSVVYVIGGPGAVSVGVFNDLRVLKPFVSRLSGADRYATAVEVAETFFGASDFAYLANGTSFPDALAAGPLAGQLGAPLYLSPGTCTKAETQSDIIRVLANGVVGVGGPAVLSDQALSGPACS